MLWRVTNRANRAAAQMADDHYSRQTPGSRQFVRPGRCLVLIAGTKPRSALWVTSWQLHADHAWPGAWECTIFRNLGAGLSSDLITEAVSATRAVFGEPPPGGMITFTRPEMIKSPNPGYCFKCAGFVMVGFTKVYRRPCLQLLPENMPAAVEPIGFQYGGLAA